VGEDLGAVALQVVDKLDTGFRPSQKSAQRALALQQWSHSEVLAVGAVGAPWRGNVK
jgi:hypothetical protein